jgi:hypothetical protein
VWGDLIGLGVILSFTRNREIYAENEPGSNLYKVISGGREVRTWRAGRDP